MLHVLNGDATRSPLARAGIPGALTVWADVLHEGPVPPDDVGAQAYEEARARYVASAGYATHAESLGIMRRWEDGLARWREHEETVLWLEHDLFDQLLLIRHLSRFADAEAAPGRLSLICIGEYPGFQDFMGLGQLSPEQLASLLETRKPVTRRQLELGRSAWRAFTDSDPRELERIAGGDTSALPFLGPALRRWLEELPWTTDGLSRTERRILRLLGEGPCPVVDLFRANNLEDRVFYLGDTSFGTVLMALAAGEGAIELAGEGRGVLPAEEARLTDLGRALSAGNADWVRDHGVDRWMGGVRLDGRDVAWRWDPDAGRVRAG